MSDMDWKAAMNSEIFREYAAIELQKQAAQKQAESLKVDHLDDDTTSELMEQFKQLEAEVSASPLKKKAFRALQLKFASDPVYTDKVDPLFVEAVMMMDLE